MGARGVRFACCALLALLLPGCGGGSDGPTGPSATPAPSGAPAGSVRFTIDSAASRHPISPYVYGMNQPGWASRSRGLRLARLGGNRWTAYNWETNASNAGADYRHQNDDYLGGGTDPGAGVRPHVAAAHAAGASMVVTVPIAGYVSADKGPAGDVSQTPDYLNTRFLESRAAKRRGFAYPPDGGDRAVFQDEFVAWLESAFPAARRDPARTLFYSLDNEPDLWVRPTRGSGRPGRSPTRSSSGARRSTRGPSRPSPPARYVDGAFALYCNYDGRDPDQLAGKPGRSARAPPCPPAAPTSPRPHGTPSGSRCRPRARPRSSSAVDGTRPDARRVPGGRVSGRSR